MTEPSATGTGPVFGKDVNDEVLGERPEFSLSKTEVQNMLNGREPSHDTASRHLESIDRSLSEVKEELSSMPAKSYGDYSLPKEDMGIEGPDVIGLIMESMSGRSAEWRKEHPVPEISDPETGLAAAKDEMRHLTRGIDLNSAHVRIAAAMVATQDREVTGRRGLSAENLADSMTPGVEGSRKSLLAQAAATLSSGTKNSKETTPARGPSAMPPFGATLARRSAER
jgi:hypothetical protein